ncbi:MAG: BTAD domain-containing putative transcriptional regulator [Candidatus Bipolaricaulis sp.]|nr:BTAD domain-containing putative transcriptional regulator [Candidatus Bipolaricaulis sp.]
METLRVRLFGYPRVECRGEPVPVPRRKAVALLTYLAVTQSAHSRDALAALLWPEQESARAYALLRNALWLLNQTPLANWVTSTRHMIGLRADPGLWIDVVQFRNALSPCRSHTHPGVALCEQGAARLEDAVGLYQDRLLAGFVVDDSRSYEEWQYSEADVLTEELMGALDALADYFETSGQPDRALGYAQRQLATQPLHEAAHRRAMRLRVALGDRAGALRQFDECARLLREELDLSPCEDTTTLAAEIRASKAGPAPARPPHRPVVTLPRFRTPFFGREQEVAQLIDLLTREDCRVVTVTGVGGSGKTRLAVEAAQSAAPRFPGGVVFVPLESVESASLAPPAIAEALDESLPHEPRPGGAPPLGSLADQLRGRRALLILDSVEHLGRDLRWLQSLIDLSEGPHFLVTSRQSLDIDGEWIYPLEGLAYPAEQGRSGDARSFAAVRMFLRAAERSDARFAASEKDVEAIGEICRLLQGLPLGIELAASWTRTMTCRAIAEEIARGLGFLSTKKSPAPRRHRSLRAAFEGSWALLDGAGREAFRALSVFRGGFSAEAAERVASTSLPAVAALVAKSLVRRASADRFEMLEVVRQFAAERLRALPDAQTRLEARHSGYYLTLLQSQEERLKGAEQKDALLVLGRDAANLYAAWRQAVGAGSFAELGSAAMSLFLLCDMTTRFAEGRELFHAAATTALDAAPPPVYGFFRGFEAWFTHFQDKAEARRLFGESVCALRTGPRDRQSAFIHVLLAFAGLPDAELSTKDLEEDLRFLEAGHPWEFAAGAEAIAARYAEEAPDRVVETIRRSLEVRAALGDAWGLALGEYSLAVHDLRLERFEAAREGFLKSGEARRQLDIDPAGQMHCLIQVGAIDRTLGRREGAVAQFSAALDLAERVHQRTIAAYCHRILAEMALELHRSGAAVAHARAALTIWETYPPSEEAVLCRELMERLGPDSRGDGR